MRATTKSKKNFRASSSGLSTLIRVLTIIRAEFADGSKSAKNCEKISHTPPWLRAARCTLRAGVNVDGSVTSVVVLANIDVNGGARMVFFDDYGTTFFHYYGRCGCGRRRVSGSGGYWRRRLSTCGDSEGDAGERQPGDEC